jgi:hypothetical protein
MKLKVAILLAAGLGVLPSIAVADTLDLLSFTYTDPANGNLTASGNLTFDATTGYVISGSGTVNSSLFVNAAPCAPCATPPTPIGTRSMTLFTATNYTSMTGNAVNLGGGVYQIADSDGTNLTFDNKFSLSAAPSYVADANGLLFAVGSPNSHGAYDSLNIYFQNGILRDFLGAGGLSQSVGGSQVFSDQGPGSLSISAVATPIPTTLPLLATGLGLIGLLGWRRKRKDSVAAA